MSFISFIKLIYIQFGIIIYDSISLNFIKFGRFLFIIIPIIILPLNFYFIFYNLFFIKRYKCLKLISIIIGPTLLILSILYYIEAFNLFSIKVSKLFHLILLINVYGVFFTIIILIVILIHKFHRNWYLRRKYMFKNNFGPYILYGENPKSQIKLCGHLSKKLIKQYKKDKKNFYILIIDEENYNKLVNKKIYNDYEWNKFEINLNEKGFWNVFLKNLTSNTIYFYKIPFINQLKSKIFKFKTPSTSIKFEFLHVSDLHASGHDINWIKNIIKNKFPNISFITSCGDFVSDGRRLMHWKTAFNQLFPISTEYAFITCTGNHDAIVKSMAKMWKLAFPYNFSNLKDGLSHYFVFQDSIFIFLDNYNNGNNNEIPSMNQINWMENILSNLPDEINKRFIFMHEAIYSTSSRGMNKDLEKIFIPIIRKYNITTLFAGHCHYFEMFFRDDLNKIGGTCFIISGGGGGLLERAMFRKLNNPPYLWESKVHEAKKWFFSNGNKNSIKRNDEIVQKYQIIGFSEYNTIHIIVNKDNINYKILGKDGNELFNFTQIFKT